MFDPKRNDLPETGLSNNKNKYNELSPLSNIKDWILDLLSIARSPRTTTFRNASARAENKIIISIIMMIFISFLQLIVYWLLRPINYLSLRNILFELIWIPLTTILIVTILFILLKEGFKYSKVSYNSIIYISSIIFSISTILLSISYLLFTILHQSSKNSMLEYTAILLVYLLATLFGLIFTIILWINFTRAILPVELRSKFILAIYWTISILLAFWVTQFINLRIINTIYFDKWYLNLGLPLIIYGIILGIFQSIVIRATIISARLWLITTVIGSLIGAILYCGILQISLQNIVLNWQIQMENNISAMQLIPYVDGTIQMRNYIGNFWNVMERGGYILPIAIAQWIVLRKKLKYSLLWVATTLICEELIFITSNDTLYLFFRWVIPGIMLTFLLTRINQHKYIINE